MTVATLKNIDEDSSPERKELATRIWRSIVREEIPVIAHYKSEVISRPAKNVGGDFHIATEDWVVVGDVSGKGIAAALLTGMFISALKLALRNSDPGKSLEHALFDELEQAGMFTTLLAVRLGADGWLNFLNIGHTPMLIRRLSGEIEEFRATVPPMGIVKLDNYPVNSTRLKAGEILCLYSDGLIEAEGNTPEEQFGLDKLKNILSATTDAQEAYNNILQALAEWQLKDDLTLLVLQYVPQSNWMEDRLDLR